MKIFLLGYMGSGKSATGKRLSEKRGCRYRDLDEIIETNYGRSISEIFEEKGELFFRKFEYQTLQRVVEDPKDEIIALGGGTPCYGNNMEIIKNSGAKSFYLKLNVENLTERLFKERSHRPLISHLENKPELEEFIRKHLFERGFYYNQSDFIVDCNERSIDEVVEAINEKLL